MHLMSYIASCATKHFTSFSILMLGRLLGGVSTSLLFSVFETWLVKVKQGDMEWGKAYGDTALVTFLFWLAAVIAITKL